MSGADFLWFLESIWFDLTNLGTADLPSLFFRLVLLFLVVFFGTVILRTVLTVVRGLLRSYLFPLLRLVWDVLTAPVWVPYRLVMRVVRRVQYARSKRDRQRWAEEQKAEAERKQRAEEARERERLAQIERMLKPD